MQDEDIIEDFDAFAGDIGTASESISAYKNWLFNHHGINSSKEDIKKFYWGE